MTKQAVIYVAVSSHDLAITDVILAHLRHTGYRCIDCTDVPSLLDIATDLHGTMSESDVIVLVDSHAFREQKPNYELQYAQSLNKPLIVISLDQNVDEHLSTWRVRLFDFTTPRHRDWQRVIDTIIDVTQEVTRPDDDFFF